jgi:hypothetical protein
MGVQVLSLLPQILQMELNLGSYCSIISEFNAIAVNVSGVLTATSSIVTSRFQYLAIPMGIF